MHQFDEDIRKETIRQKCYDAINSFNQGKHVYNEDTLFSLSADVFLLTYTEFHQFSKNIIKNYIEFNAAWDLRKLILKAALKYWTTHINGHQCLTISNEVCKQIINMEFDIVADMLSENLKSFNIWSHFLYLIHVQLKFFENRLVDIDFLLSLLFNYLGYCNYLLKFDTRNFHVFNCRQSIIKQFEILSKNANYNTKVVDLLLEMMKSYPFNKVSTIHNINSKYNYDEIVSFFNFYFSTSLIMEDLSNYSAWSLRSCEMSKGCIQQAINGSLEKKFLREVLFIEPNNESAWLYHKWYLNTIILNELHQRLNLNNIIVKFIETDAGSNSFIVILLFQNRVKIEKSEVKSTLPFLDFPFETHWQPLDKNSFFDNCPLEIPLENNKTTSMDTLEYSCPDLGKYCYAWFLNINDFHLNDVSDLMSITMKISLCFLSKNISGQLREVFELTLILHESCSSYSWICLKPNCYLTPNINVEENTMNKLNVKYSSNLISAIMNDVMNYIDELLFYQSILKENNNQSELTLRFQNQLLQQFFFVYSKLPLDIKETIDLILLSSKLSEVSINRVDNILIDMMNTNNANMNKIEEIRQKKATKKITWSYLRREDINQEFFHVLPNPSETIWFKLALASKVKCTNCKLISKDLIKSGLFLLISIEELDLSNNLIDDINVVIEIFYRPLFYSKMINHFQLLNLSYNPLSSEPLNTSPISVKNQTSCFLHLKPDLFNYGLPRIVDVTGSNLSLDLFKSPNSSSFAQVFKFYNIDYVNFVLNYC